MKTQNDESVRVCPYCAEQIKAAARVCPHCRQWLSAWSLRNTGSAVVVIYLLFLILMVGMLIYVRQLFSAGLDFSPYRDSLAIVESRMSLRKTPEGIPMVDIVVLVTNQSDFAWKNLEFDSRFFNKAGQMIDARPCRDNSTILPHDDLAVRIATKPLKDLSEYESHKVYIRAALDARSQFD